MPEPAGISPLDEHVGYWLRFVSNHVSHAFKMKLQAKGVTVAEWVLLRALLRTGPTCPARLAEELGMTRGTISKLMDRAHSKRLVTRAADRHDGRVQRVALTPSGRRLVPVLAKLADENDQAFFGHLSGQQRVQLLGILKDMVRMYGWKDVPMT